jgi:hypothetical protein
MTQSTPSAAASVAVGLAKALKNKARLMGRREKRTSLNASTSPVLSTSTLDGTAAAANPRVDAARKPLPTPPTEPELPSEPPTPPVRYDVDPTWNQQAVRLDDACIAHLKSLLRQALENVYLLPIPWEEVLFNITTDLAENVTRSLDILSASYATLDGSSHATETKKHYEFMVTLLDVEGDQPENSKFVHGQFDGRPLFRRDDTPDLLDPNVCFVGGTIVLHGDRRELNKASRIMELLVHAVCSQALEMCVLRDHHALRTRQEIALAEWRAEVRDGTSKSGPYLGSRRKHRRRLGNQLTIIPTGTVSSSGASSPTSTSKRIAEGGLARAASPHSSSGIWNWLTGRGPIEERAIGNVTMLKPPSHRPHYLHRPSSSSSSSSTTKITPTRELPTEFTGSLTSLELRGSNRFARILYQMERTVLTTSPDVVFPPPQLLLRLRAEEEEDERLEFEITTSLSTPLVPSGHESLGQLASVAATIVGGGQVDGATGEHTLSNDGLHLKNTPFDTRRSRPTILPSRSSRGIAIDAKTGLSYLSTNNNSLEGVFRHQSLTFLYSNYVPKRSTLPCHPPELRTIDYYRRDLGDSRSDYTLAEFLVRLCDEAGLTCPAEECGRYMYEHVNTYLHAHGRINITVEETSQPMPTGIDPDDQTAIIMWTTCRVCNRSTDKVLMSMPTRWYSFGKYLELLLYNPRFMCHIMCQHSVTRDLPIRFFRLGRYIVRIEQEAVDLFDVRVPRIQVDPDLALLPATRELLRRDDLPDPEEALQMLQQINADIAQFYSSVKEHITLLEEFTGVEACVRGEGTLEQMVCQTMLEEMTRDFCHEESELYEAVRTVDARELNDIRRILKLNAQSAMTRINLWRKVHAEGCKKEEEAPWKLPEYIASPLAHVFPGSRVILREDEPSSIISYTLSSRTFQQALAEMSTPPPTPDEEVARINGHYYTNEGFDQLSYAETDYEQSVVTESDYGASVAAPSYFGTITFTDTHGGADNHLETESQHQQVDGDDVALFIKHWPPNDPYSPHLKLKFSEGNMKFSCIVYYASQFDQLRRKCGISGMYIQSLARCNPWSAQNAKSQCSFFKTHDDRLVVKQMLDNWTSAEKDALLKFAPSYFSYVDHSSQYPSVMAKIFGFYTIKYKNIHTGKTMKMDLLVMEHLFYKQTITQKFSLKGILGRPSDSRKDSDEALCDDDWVKGNYRNILMTHGHSKNIIREAIHNDTRFLAESNIVDYSLLVGVDEQRKELVIGIVGEYHDVEGFLNQWH